METKPTRKFTYRQREFARLYAEGMKAAEAAKAAGYAASTAETNAARLLRHEPVCAYIDAYREARRMVEPEDWMRMRERLRRIIDECADDDTALKAVFQLRMKAHGARAMMAGVPVEGEPEVVYPDALLFEPNHPVPANAGPPLLKKEGSLAACGMLPDVDTLPSGEPAFDVRMGPVKPEVVQPAPAVTVRFVTDGALEKEPGARNKEQKGGAGDGNA